MGISAYIAKILGPYCVVMAIGFLVNRRAYQQIMNDFVKNAAWVYLGGALAFVVGIIIVLAHNVWVLGWPVIITIFGWGAIVKGVWLIVFPNKMITVIRAYQNNDNLLLVHMVIVLATGIVLIVGGYF